MTRNVSPGAPIAFTLFPSLPFEIRLKIYSYVNHQPRTVTLVYQNVPPWSPSPETPSNSEDTFKIPDHEKRWVSLSSVPPMLHVNRESRLEALKIYTLSFGSPARPGTTYFNFSLDTLRFGNPKYISYDGGHQENFDIYKRRRVWTVDSHDGATEADEETGPGGLEVSRFVNDIHCVDDAWKVERMQVDFHARHYYTGFLFKVIRTSFLRLEDLTLVIWNEKRRTREFMMPKIGGTFSWIYKKRYGGLTSTRKPPEVITVVAFPGEVWGRLGLEFGDRGYSLVNTEAEVEVEIETAIAS